MWVLKKKILFIEVYKITYYNYNTEINCLDSTKVDDYYYKRSFEGTDTMIENYKLISIYFPVVTPATSDKATTHTI